MSTGSVKRRESAEITEELSSPPSPQDATEKILEPEIRAKAERLLVRKLDLRLMPMIALIFIMNYIGLLVGFVPKTGHFYVLFHRPHCYNVCPSKGNGKRSWVVR
jgi:hypothetical protein